MPIPKFKEKIANGGPVTVTHPDIIRYFMTIPAVSRLVLQAAAIDESGQVLVLDMCEPVKTRCRSFASAVEDSSQDNAGR
jgi:FlaA1/EpsC-like NDP-sugar epimerase